MEEPLQNKQNYDGAFDLYSVFSILFKRRKIIIFGTLVAAFLSIGISLLLPRVYRSEGFYQLGNPTKKIVENEEFLRKETVSTQKITSSIGVPVQIYKSSSTQFFNPNRFQLIASKEKSFGEEESKKIKNNFRTTQDIQKWIKPVYAFAKEDTREYAQLPQNESNSVIGLNLSYESDSPDKAYAYVRFFGYYVRDCLLYLRLYNYVMEEYANTKARLNKIENQIIETQFEITQNTDKMKDIQAILSNYPESAKIESRQLVSIQEGGDRFLAPITQLVGIESALAVLRRDLAELERDKEKLTLRDEYFSHCFNEMLKNGEHGESLLLLIELIKDKVFKDKDLSKHEIKEVINSISIDLQTFHFIFNQNSRFVSGPTIPSVPIKPQRSLIVIVSCMGSFFLFIFVALVSHWWQSNKKEVM